MSFFGEIDHTCMVSCSHDSWAHGGREGDQPRHPAELQIAECMWRMRNVQLCMFDVVTAHARASAAG
eukprot:COSAG02_NODE_58779_length_276_cov_0.785311_1_plen_66_part_10